MNQSVSVESQRALPSWLLLFIEPLRPLYHEALVASLFTNILALATPIFVLQVYDRVVFHSGMSTLQGLALGMALVVAFEFVLRQARGRILQRVALRIDADVGPRLFKKLLSLPLRILEQRPASHWQTLFRDVEHVRNTLSGPTAVLAMDLPFAILFLGVVFVIAWPVAWVLLAVFAVFVALAWRSGTTVAEAADNERRKNIVRDGLMGEIVMGRTTIKAAALTRRMAELWEERQAETILQSMDRGRKADFYIAFGQSLSVVATVSMTVVGAIAIMNQQMTIGALIAANMLAGRLIGPFQQLVGAWRGFALFRQSAARLEEAFSEFEDIGSSSVAMPRPKGHIKLEDVTFSYGPGAPPVTDRLKLEIIAGGLTAVMGRNGSGKTTLLKLILGLYKPTEGRVRIDSADISQFAPEDLAHWIGYVPQECVLFNGTIRDNLTFGKPDATNDDIVRAATLSTAHDLIISLPEGYGTLVGEGGGGLSAGLRQRLAIARALVGDPPMIIMDEPTSSLDRQAEEQLRAALLKLSTDHTILVVTHSPVLLEACTHTIVMDSGKVRAAGRTRTVLEYLTQQKEGETKSVLVKNAQPKENPAGDVG
jgi:ATP-binding cassette, subfamily C, bacterial LapB